MASGDDAGRMLSGTVAGGVWEPQAGCQIVIQGALVPPYLGPTGILPNVGNFEGRLLALQSWQDRGCNILGNAALVAPGIAVAASHVIEQFVRDGHFQKEDHAIFASGFRSDEVDMWEVRQIQMQPAYDVAILELVLRKKYAGNYTFNIFEMSTALPEVGTAISIFGFVASETKFSIAASPDRVEAAGAVVASAGLVTALYPSGRDRAMLPFPVVEVECRAVGGMSGGPAFDSDGNLIGIVTSSIDPDENGVGARVYISLLWPGLVTEVHPKWPAKFYPDVPTRLMNIPHIVLKHSERLRMNEQGTGYEYDHRI